MTIIGLYDFRRLDTEKPMIGVYLVSSGIHLGTIIKVLYEPGWTVSPGSGITDKVFLDEISAADALHKAWKEIPNEGASDEG